MHGGTAFLRAQAHHLRERSLLRGHAGAQIEISLATMAYNLKTMMNVLGAAALARA